jgi:hypothetical protein
MEKLFLVAFVLLSTSVFAQKTWDYSIGGSATLYKNDGGISNPGNSGNIDDNSDYYGGIRSGIVPASDIEEITPLAPATLLLLGLGGATVGTAVCRNQKRRK